MCLCDVFLKVKPHLSVFTDVVVGLIGKGKVGIKDFVSFGVGDFVLVFHNFFPTSMYFSIAVRLIVCHRSSNHFAYRKDNVYKEIIQTLLLSEKSSDYLNLV